MRKRIKADKTLNEQLAAAYYTCQTIDISPEMQLILYRHWGPPTSPCRPTFNYVVENEKHRQGIKRKSNYIFLNISFIFFIVYYVFHFAFTTFFGKEDNYHLYSYLQKEKAFHKAFGKMTVFFIPNRASESSQRRLCLSPAEVLSNTNRASVSSPDRFFAP